MLDQTILDRVHNSVCAIGYLPIPLQQWQSRPVSHPFKVIGSGFLVRETTVITNRHVIRDLIKEAEAEDIPDEQLFLSFVALIDSKHILNTVRMIRRRVGVQGTDEDVGFIEFRRKPNVHFEKIKPLTIDEQGDLRITEEVYVCGYPHGSKLMMKDGEVYRLGPVIQHGYISGLSPFGRTKYPDEILLDVRTAKGMSGSPVFRPNIGSVIGIHNEAISASGISTTSYAIPLRKDIVVDWLRKFDESPEHDDLDTSEGKEADA